MSQVRFYGYFAEDFDIQLIDNSKFEYGVQGYGDDLVFMALEPTDFDEFKATFPQINTKEVDYDC